MNLPNFLEHRESNNLHTAHLHIYCFLYQTTALHSFDDYSLLSKQFPQILISSGASISGCTVIHRT